MSTLKATNIKNESSASNNIVLDSGGGVVVSGVTTVTAGSASAPAISFNDSNTGLYSPGADQVAVATNGTGRLFVDANGTVRVNSAIQATSNGGLNVEVTSNGSSSAPFTLLNRGTSNDTGVFLTYRGLSSASAETDYAYMQMLATDTSSRNGAIALWTCNGGTVSERLRITSAGLMGLGTSTPTSQMSVQASGVNGIHLAQQANNGANSGRLFFDNSTNIWTAYSTEGTFKIASGATIGTTSGTDRLVIDSAGLMGLGTSSPLSELHIEKATQAHISVKTASSNMAKFGSKGNDVYIAGTAGATNVIFKRNVISTDHPADSGTETARIDSSGRLLVGTSTSNSNTNSKFQIADTSGNVTTTSYSANNSNAGYYYFFKTRGTSVDSHTVLQSGDGIANLFFAGSDGTTYRGAASIEAVADGGWSSGDAPGRLVFSTTADGASGPTERMRIDSSGQVLIGKTSGTITTVGKELYAGYGSHTASGNEAANFNRLSSDGTVIGIYQDSNLEGTISVSGSTVSYNGAHLSRWSQLPSGAERTEILRGSVLSNIDEMCEWGDEENEQLNRMKVSDVEGDKNVSGVFQAWDDDDDTYTNDFYCAMTGDFIIRIAEDVTVERGDLLMSAGDGTAKPQDDDIIRSKTIAKVTSINVSCTYDDGSYCVPCVLMAC